MERYSPTHFEIFTEPIQYEYDQNSSVLHGNRKEMMEILEDIGKTERRDALNAFIKAYKDADKDELLVAMTMLFKLNG